MLSGTWLGPESDSSVGFLHRQSLARRAQLPDVEIGQLRTSLDGTEGGEALLEALFIMTGNHTLLGRTMATGLVWAGVTLTAFAQQPIPPAPAAAGGDA